MSVFGFCKNKCKHEVYTIQETNDLLGGKAPSSHTHTKSQITDWNHNHDDRYYTESEVNNLLKTQSTTFSVTNSGITFTFNIKKNINVVNVRITMTIPANITSDAGGFAITDKMPDWAKISSSESKVLGIGYNLGSFAVTNDITTIAGGYKCNLRANTGKYTITYAFLESTTYSEPRDVLLDITYIL